jgi:hypothetical protein
MTNHIQRLADVAVRRLDINQAIIASGAALACPHYDARYLQYEQADALAAQSRAPYCERTTMTGGTKS